MLITKKKIVRAKSNAIRAINRGFLFFIVNKMRASYILGDIVEYFLINNKSFFIPKGNFFFLSYFYEKTADFSTVVFIFDN